MQKFSYFGYKVISEDDEQLSNLYSDKTINWYDLVENQYLVVVDGDGNDVDRFKWQDGKHKSVVSKTLDSAAVGKIKPLNVEQKLAIDALMDATTTVKVLAGNFGSGKDMLMAAAAFNLLQAEKFERIVWCRNNMEVKDTSGVGFLPGGLFEKISWTAGPLMDHLGGADALRMHMDSGKVEVQHLGHIRGRDIRNAIIICSEAENLTQGHVRLLLGRVAAGSNLWINGDLVQCDSKAFERDNGLAAAVDKLGGNRLFSYVYMPHSVRSETAKLADLLN